jgi:adenylyltransferase/sulfurtransferase
MDQPRFELNEDRYSRLQLIAWWDQRRLQRSRVLVVGAGALGNEVLKNLALIGVGQIDIVDFDRIENSNLSRAVLFREQDRGCFKAEVAAKALGQLNPQIHVEAIVGNVLTDIGLGRVRAADVVIGCLDNREARLWVNRMCWKVNRPWIDGGIQEISGVAKVFRPPDGPCYECGMTDDDYRLIQLRYSCPLLKQSDLQQGRVPTAPTIASIIGGLQVQEALKLLHDFPADNATAFVFNGVSNQFYQTRYPLRPDCMSHETYEDIVATDLTADARADELFQLAHAEGADGRLELVLDRDWVWELACQACATSRSIERPLSQVSVGDAVCGQCGQAAQPKMLHRVAFGDSWSQRTLRQLGIPDFDIVKVESSAGSHYYQLKPQ